MRFGLIRPPNRKKEKYKNLILAITIKHPEKSDFREIEAVQDAILEV